MKLYQVLSLLPFVAVASCADDGMTDATECGVMISFGPEASQATSRAADECAALEEIALIPDRDDSDISPVATYITVGDMPAPHLSGRGLPVSGVADLGTFSIYSFFYSAPAAAPQRFFSNEKVSDKGGYWTTSTPYYWPTTAGSTLSFTALRGADASSGVIVAESTTIPGALEIDYNVPKEAGEQPDLMIAVTDRLNTPGVRVPLKFSHLCAGVQFVIGNEMQPGTITGISLTDVKNHGRYSSSWNDLSGDATFTISTDRKTSADMSGGTSIMPDSYTLMMIPQQLGDNARLVVDFADDVTGRTRTLTASLAGQTWRQGKMTIYHIGITPEYDIEFTQSVPVQDAHYVICNSEVRVNNIPSDKKWTLTAEATNISGDDVSVQLTSDINEFARQGFWTDKTMTNGTTINNVSARGSRTITGTGPGTFPLTVFLPENISDSERTVTLTVSVDGAPSRYAATQQITQLCPAWNGNSGWEQINDNQNTNFGFNYTDRHIYVYTESTPSEWYAERVKNRVLDLIQQYNATNYATAYVYVHERKLVITNYRNYVEIDYSKLNNLDGKTDDTDGLKNTKTLFSLGGTALTNVFEDALNKMIRVGTSSTKAYRPRDINDPETVPLEYNGNPELIENSMLKLALKRNKYYLNTSVITTTDGDLRTTTALIREQDIKWYIPARNQFTGAPTWYGGISMNLDDYWSSTAVDDIERAEAYIGSGISELRTTSKLIRMMRTRD